MRPRWPASPARRRSGNPLSSCAAESGWSEFPAAGQFGGRGREEHSDGDHAAVLPTGVRRLGRRRRCRLLPVREGSRTEHTSRAGPDSCRHARSGGRAQVRHTDADPAGDAQSGHDQTAGRQAPGLLRDLYAADPAADSPRRPPQDHGLGVRRDRGGEQPRAAHPQRSLAHDRGDVEQAGSCEVDQRPRRQERGIPSASASRRPDPALGQPTRRPSRAGQPPDVRRDTRRVQGPGADRHARARRRRRGRRQRRVRGGLVPPCGRRHPVGLCHRGHLVRLLRRQGGWGVRRRVGARLRDLPVPERQPRLDDLVPRPRARHDAAQRLRRPGRLLPRPRRAGRRFDGARLANRPRGVASRPGASGERQVPPEQALPGDPDRDPGSLLQRGRLALLPRLAHVLRRAGRRLHPRRAVFSDLESGVLRQHDHGQRQHVAVPRSRAAPLPLPLPQWLPVTLPDPRLRRDPGRRGLADRERGRLSRGAGRRHGRPRQPAAHGPCRAGRRDRRLHHRAGGEPRTRQRRSRRAVRRRHPRGRLPRRRSRHDRPDHAVQRRPRRSEPTRRRHHGSCGCPRSRRSRPRR